MSSLEIARQVSLSCVADFGTHANQQDMRCEDGLLLCNDDLLPFLLCNVCHNMADCMKCDMPAQRAQHAAGACFSLLSAAVLVVFFSLLWPQNYDWKDMKFQTFDNIEDKVPILMTLTSADTYK